jgi:lipopolysaccharide transport system ATP-binding protein
MNTSCSDLAFEITDLHKTFMLKHYQAGTIKRALLEVFKRTPYEIREVLHGINLTIRQGESVALIGRNGSGKSTLLSVIARVYRPTSGSVVVHGRFAPLLDLCTGFHPDLTGVENLSLYAAIVGIPQKVMQDRLHDIVNFAFDSQDLVEKLDTPVRNYSDGMKMRLGFAAAIHSDPESLIIDEVLAVGDEAFQLKCYRRLADFHDAGKTILFVSHDMRAVRQVATRVIWLHNGRIRMDGPTTEVVDAYVAASDHPDFGITP